MWGGIELHCMFLIDAENLVRLDDNDRSLQFCFVLGQ